MGEEPRDLSHHGGELGGRRRDRDGIEIEGLESDVLEQRELFASTGSLSSPTSWGGGNPKKMPSQSKMTLFRGN